MMKIFRSEPEYFHHGMRMLVHFETIYIRFESQSQSLKFKVTEEKQELSNGMRMADCSWKADLNLKLQSNCVSHSQTEIHGRLKCC